MSVLRQIQIDGVGGSAVFVPLVVSLDKQHIETALPPRLVLLQTNRRVIDLQRDIERQRRIAGGRMDRRSDPQGSGIDRAPNGIARSARRALSSSGFSATSK